jgi:hypothetical protein
MAPGISSITRFVFWNVIIFLLALYPLHRFGGVGLVKAVCLGFILGLGNILFSFISIRWGFGRSTKAFLLVVLGGMMMRFFVLGIALFLIWRFTHLPLFGFLVAFIISYILLQYYEVRFVTQELKNGKKQKRD